VTLGITNCLVQPKLIRLSLARAWGCLWFCLIFSSAVFSYNAGECQGVEPPTSGDWVINSSTDCSDSIIDMDGNLLIENTFDLNFSNVTLIINSSDSRRLYIRNNGSFNIDNSNLTSKVYTEDDGYGWENYEDSALVLENSDISYVGYDFSNDGAGITVRCDNSIIKENRITQGYSGIYLLDSYSSLIENNNITTSDYSTNSRGIYLDGSTCDVSGNSIIAPHGIVISDDFSSNVSDNLVFSDEGIEITNANHTFLNNNNIRDLDGFLGTYAILISSSENILIENFNISKYKDAVRLDSSNNITVRNSHIEKSWSGIYLEDSNENSFSNISIVNSTHEDLTLDFSDESFCNNYFSDVSNSDGKTVGFYNESVEISDQEFSQLTLCNSDNSNLTNIIINSSNNLKNNNLNLLFSDNCILDNLSSVYNKEGIKLRYSSDNLIKNSKFNLNENDGILNYYSDNNIFLNITSDLNEFGLSIVRSKNITINDSKLRENYVGFEKKYDLNIGYFNFSSDDPDYVCSHNINRVNGSNYPIGYYNSATDVSDKVFSELIVCGLSNSVFSNITLISSGGNRNNILYLRDLTNFELTNFSINRFYGGLTLENVNNSNFTNGYLNDSQVSVFLYDSYNNIFDNVSVYDGQFSGYALRYSHYNIIKNSWILNSVQAGFMVYDDSEDNSIFNNYLENTLNAFVSSSAEENFWNTSLTLGTNIVGGGYIGGNFWSKTSGDGFSDVCSNTTNGICNENNIIRTENIDYLPLITSAEITNCGYEINSAGSYYLSGNLSLGSSNSSCIEISSDNVSLNCNGFFVNGGLNLGYGILAKNISGLEVQNCSFELLGKSSIFLDNVSGSLFENVLSSYSDASGFYLVDSSSNSFNNNNISSSYEDGFSIVNSSLNSFNDNTVLNNSLAGFYLVDSDSNNISENKIFTNGIEGESGVTIENSENNSIFNNVFNNSDNINVSNAFYSNNIWNYSYGNYWGSPVGDGFSDICNDGDGDGFCDLIYNFSLGSITAVDYLPISDINILTQAFHVDINYSDWDNETTNFSEFNNTKLENLPDVRFVHNYGAIWFKGNISILRDLNLNGNVIVSSNRIFVDSSALPEFNVPAELRLHGLSFNLPRILKDGSVCGDCVWINYSGGTLVFNVSSFSEYSSDEGSCLDGVQNFGEEGIDCGGICSACDSGGSSGGGGGGGGASSGASSALNESSNESKDVGRCVENITCGEWGECIEGVERRFCEDSNECLEGNVEKRDCESDTEGKSKWIIIEKLIFSLIGLIIIAWLCRLVYFKIRHRNLVKKVVSAVSDKSAPPGSVGSFI